MEHSILNEVENEGLIVLGRTVKSDDYTAEFVTKSAEAVEALAKSLGIEGVGLVYCGTTINWPGDVDAGMVIGKITLKAAPIEDDEDEDEDDGGDEDYLQVVARVQPEHMDLAQVAGLNDAFWKALEEKHGIVTEGENDAYLAAAGWTYATLNEDEVVASAEAEGFAAIPKDFQTIGLGMSVECM